MIWTEIWFEGPIEVIPAVDVLGEEAVRLHQGDYDAVVERAEDSARARPPLGRRGRRPDPPRRPRRRPVRPRAPGARPRAWPQAGLPVQASGGIRSLEDARALLEAGADRVIVGTAAWPDPTPWFELGEALVLALDVRDGQVRAAGWTESAGISVRRRARLTSRGVASS